MNCAFCTGDHWRTAAVYAYRPARMSGLSDGPVFISHSNFPPCMRWGVAQLLDSFTCPALTQNVCKVIQAAQESEGGWCEEPKGPRVGRKGRQGAECKKTEVDWGKSVTLLWASCEASYLFIAPGSAIPLSGAKVGMCSLRLCPTYGVFIHCVWRGRWFGVLLAS